jgi:uncharacterized protein (TIGR02594 family)
MAAISTASLAVFLRALLGFFAPKSNPAGVPDTPAAPSAEPASAKPGDSPPWLIWAQKDIGFHERPGNRGIEKYIALARCGQEGDPWCAIFVNAALEANGIRGTRSAMARSFERDANFVRLSGPALGAITTMWRGSPSAGTGHVFFYVGENDSGVIALGGNQQDEVKLQGEPRRRITGHWWPRSYPLPKKTGPIRVAMEDLLEGSES